MAAVRPRLLRRARLRLVLGVQECLWLRALVRPVLRVPMRSVPQVLMRRVLLVPARSLVRQLESSWEGRVSWLGRTEPSHLPSR
jgi:hypothetical protein